MKHTDAFLSRQWKALAAAVLLVVTISPGTAQFTQVNAGFTAVSSGRALWGDYDNDGKLDLLITGFISGYGTGSTVVYHNNGSGSFTAVSTPFVQVGYSAGAWGDYDNDGYLDLVLSGMPTGSGDGISQLYHNSGNGTFSLTAALAGSWFGSECWGDYNHDGYQDLLQGGRLALVLYRNDGGTLVNNGISFPYSGDYYTHAVWADFNNDGNIDIAAAVSTSYPNRGRILRNDNGVFNVMQEFPNRLFASAAWGDYDNDGFLDLAIIGYDNVQGPFATIYHNDGGTNFSDSGIVLPGANYSSIAWGDYNNDGRLDLLLGGQGSSGNVTRLFRNDGSNVFTLVWTAPQELGDAVVSWGDYDNDGRLDFVICGLTNGVKVTQLFHNDCPVANTPPTAPTQLSVQKNGKSAVLSWRPATDAEQSGGLSYNVRMGTTPGGIDRISPKSDPATGWRRVPELGNAFLRTNYPITNLSAGTYYWSVQAVDHAYAGSAFAAESSFTISGPTITNQPQTQTVLVGQMVTFTVGAGGTDPLGYQWRFNGVAIPGATNSVFVVTNALFVNQGNYSVAVSDVVGTTVSTDALLTVNSGPVITSQPQGQTVAPGAGVSFSVGVIGNTPFRYQWYHDGNSIPTETNSTLVLLNAPLSSAGRYAVAVTNAYGGMLSSNALLSVYQPPSGVQAVSASGAVDMVYDGARDIIYITSGSSILRYQVGSNAFLTPFVLGTGLNLWQVDLSFNGNTLVATDWSGGGRSIYVVDLPSGTSQQVLLPPSPFGDAGTFAVAFGNDNAALVTGDFPGSGPVSLRRYDAVAGTNSSLGTVYYRSLVSASGDGNFLGIIQGTVSSGDLYKYSVGGQVITNSTSNGWFCWIAPGVNRNGSQFAYATDGGTFIYDTNLTYATTIGSYFADRPVGVVYHPAADQVYFVWGGSSDVRVYDTTTLTETTRYDFGTYFSSATGTTVKNNVRIRISRDGTLLMVNVGNAIKYLRLGGTAPQVTAQPADAGAGIGGSALFSVTASGTGPLNYQWFRDGVVVAGATGSTLTLTNLQADQFGGYSVAVFSPYGWATSSVAPLTLSGPPYFTQQPQGQNVVAGTSASLQALAVGSLPIGYQWQLSYTNVAGATNASLVFDHFSYSNAGPYVAIATNSMGAATSQVATMLFIPVLRPSVTMTSLVLNWEGSFTLQSATNVTGPYLDLAPATSPFTNWPATNEMRRFFRLRGTE